MARTIIGLLTGTWGMGSGVSERAMDRRILMFTSVGTAGALAGKARVLARSSRQLRRWPQGGYRSVKRGACIGKRQEKRAAAVSVRLLVRVWGLVARQLRQAVVAVW
jgi:hypothetical protein